MGAAYSTGLEMSAHWRHFPNNFLYSGTVYRDTISTSRGSSGMYWSASSRSGYWTYSLWISPSSISPSYSEMKYYGCTIRCMAKIE